MLQVSTLELHGPKLQATDSVTKERQNISGISSLHRCVRTMVPLLQDAEHADQLLQLAGYRTCN